MNKRLKAILLAVMLLVTVLAITSCAEELSPAEENYGQSYYDGYTVSVKYDAGEGQFGTGVSTIVDTFDISKLKVDENGKVSIKLLDPTDDRRTASSSYTLDRTGYFFAGWYINMQEESSLDIEGNTLYTYSEKWDFDEDVLTLDADGSYNAAVPELTLHAAWLPQFRVNFYSTDPTDVDEDGERRVLYTLKLDSPYTQHTVALPSWNLETGEQDFNSLKDDTTLKEQYTFIAAYDEDGEELPATFEHTGVFNEESATVTGAIMNVYLDMVHEKWYHIYTAEQFAKHMGNNANLEIYANLDFSNVKDLGEIWGKNLGDKRFTGTIKSADGEVKVLKNITSVQNSGVPTFGLFGELASAAVIENIRFEDATVEIGYGISTGNNARFGLLAGEIARGATLTNVSVSGTIKIADNIKLPSSDYDIGLAYGLGYSNAEGIDYSEVTLSVIESENPKYSYTTGGNKIVVSKP